MHTADICQINVVLFFASRIGIVLFGIYCIRLPFCGE